jgi:hypothetical protein
MTNIVPKIAFLPDILCGREIWSQKERKKPNAKIEQVDAAAAPWTLVFGTCSVLLPVRDTGHTDRGFRNFLSPSR